MRRTIHVQASSDGIRDAADSLDGIQAEYGLGAESVWPIQVALDEILSNIVGHGHRGLPDRSIRVTFDLEGDQLEVTVVDDAPAFDPLALREPDTTTPIDARRPGGLGLYFVKSLMDRVEYARRDEQNWLVLARRVSR